MYISSQDPVRPSVHRRRRPRRKKTYRLLYIVNVLMLLFAAVQVFGDIREQGAKSRFITEAGAIEEARDTTAPTISGVKDITLYAGDAVTYYSGVTVSDDKDASPTLEVDSSQVDPARPGSYTVTYYARDNAGNQSSATATITVLQKQPDYVDLETIYEAVDTELAGILTQDMTALQQVTAIYSWARTTRTYGGHTDHSDYRQAAYEMLITGRGDCFSYFSVTKLMFERLNIPNIDVQKVKTHANDSDHFWSLVSVDGGNTYYHFDATPRVGEGDNFCLVTDAFLDAYSAEHNNSHNRNKTLYPATPEE